jgi:hypothetical protein
LNRPIETPAQAAAGAKARPMMSQGESVAAAAAPMTNTAFAPSPLALNRRPGIELSLSAPAVSAAGGAAEDNGSEHSLFDVPAFLRRQS